MDTIVAKEELYRVIGLTSSLIETPSDDFVFAGEVHSGWSLLQLFAPELKPSKPSHSKLRAEWLSNFVASKDAQAAFGIRLEAVDLEEIEHYAAAQEEEKRINAERAEEEAAEERAHEERLEALNSLELGTIISFRSDHRGKGSQIHLAMKIVGYVGDHDSFYEQWTDGAPKCSKDGDTIYSEPGFDEDFLADQDYAVISTIGNHSTEIGDFDTLPCGSVISGADSRNKLIWAFKAPLTWDAATGTILTSDWVNSFGAVEVDGLEDVYLNRGSYSS